MTNEEFAQWRARHFRSRAAAAEALELHRDTVTALETGKTKNGEIYPVRHHIALACQMIDHQAAKGAAEIAQQLRQAADWIEAKA